MKRHVILLITLLLTAALGQAQTKQHYLQPYGTVDTADLKLTECSFEKGAHAMILFDKADVTTSYDSVVVTRHKRIKIFNEFGKDLASVRLPFVAFRNYESIPLVQAQTIRLENGKIITTRVEPSLIYTENIDKVRKALVFTFPEVKPGCIIEYRYKWRTANPAGIPTWFFQSTIPNRYSEVNVNMASYFTYTTIHKGLQPFLTDTSEAVPEGKKSKSMLYHWAIANVHSLVDEPYANPGNNGAQCMMFQLHSILTRMGNYVSNPQDSWLKISRVLWADQDFKDQFDLRLSKQNDLLKHVDSLHNDEEKISYLFDAVKKNMTWNNQETWYASDGGVRKAWANKKGNSADINLCLYNLLKHAGIETYPMLVSTRDNGVISPDYANISLINKLVLFVPVDSAKYYVLDASSKYNIYNEVPANLLNTYGIQLTSDAFGGSCKIMFLKNPVPALLNVTVDAVIDADSKVHGKATFNNFSYSRAGYKEAYDKLGTEKYTDFLRGADNSIKITDLQLDNMETDSLPLVQHFQFHTPLKGSDDQYIYFNAGLFNPLQSNPFFSDQRFTDIDFAFCGVYMTSGHYKLPAGYSLDIAPKDVLLNMADKSIVFKRIMREEDGALNLNYSIIFRRSQFSVDEYQGIHDFYKKMFQIMNEPVVLKKKKV